MIRKSYWKKIAMAVMVSAIMIQNSAAVVLAEETEVMETSEVVAVAETEAPQTEAPETEAPQTEAPQTEAPQTEAPQTEAPQTEAPQTEAPQTEAPQTEAPQTEAPQTEAPQTEAPQTEAPQTEAPQTEAAQTEAAQTEAPAEAEAAQTEAPAEAEVSQDDAEETEASGTEEEEPEASETEAQKETYKTDFSYSDGEVIVTAKASEAARLPENSQIVVRRLAEGTAEYEAARQAAAGSGAGETASYRFYDVSFEANGEKIDPADGTVSIQIQFTAVQVNASRTQKVLHIKGAGVTDVTASAAEGSSVSSCSFNI